MLSARGSWPSLSTEPQSRSRLGSTPAAWDRPGPEPVASAIDPELVAAMRKLPTRQRAALWLRYGHDLSVGDVAKIMGCSDRAAKQLLLRGRDALRVQLSSHSQEDSR